MENPKVSIVVVAHNQEDYLRDCLESIVKQTYPNIEIILIDDGSTDQTPSICEQFNDKFRQIILLHQQYSGVGTSRNNALAVAQGKFIAFVQANDWLPDEGIAKLVKLQQKSDADITATHFYDYQTDNNQFQYYFTSKDYYELTMNLEDWFSIDTKNIMPYPEIVFKTSASKLYRRSLFKNVYYPQNDYSDDELDEAMNWKLYLLANKIQFALWCGYFRRMKMHVPNNSELSLHASLEQAGVLELIHKEHLQRRAAIRYLHQALQVPEKLTKHNLLEYRNAKLYQQIFDKFRNTHLISDIESDADIKISIIIPTHNDGKYIRKCLESVLNQTYKNFVVIIIDDGSTDQTATICEEFRDKYDNIVLIHQNNQGIGQSRNVGLSIAMKMGNFISFVDGDDWLPHDSLERMVKLQRKDNADIVSGDFYQFHTERSYFSMSFFENDYYERTMSPQEWIVDYDYSDSFFYRTVFQVCWGKLFRASLFKNVMYPTLILGEYDETNWKVYLLANKITFALGNFYIKRVNSESVTHGKNIPIGLSIKAPLERMVLLKLLGIDNYKDQNAYVVRQVNFKDQMMLCGDLYDYYQEKLLIQILEKYQML